MNRRQEADKLLLQAINNFKSDPNGQVSLLRTLAMAVIVQAMLMQEGLDGVVELQVEDDDEPPKGELPW
jgi:hypothetical protein